MRRWALRMFAVLAVFAVAAYFGGRAYLRSDDLVRRVERRLSKMLGVPVTIEGVEVGISGCSATGLQFREAGATREAKPFLTVSRADIDIGLSDFLSGQTHPELITVTDFQLELRLDPEGKILTRLPEPSLDDAKPPVIRVVRGQVKILRTGWPEFLVRGIDVDVTCTVDLITVAGSIDDSEWGGAWTTAGRIARPSGQGTFELHNPKVNVTQSVLRRVPFVSPSVWTHFSAEGQTPVDILLTLRPPEPIGYRVELAPVHTSVYVPSIDLRAADASGKVVVENSHVLLRGIRGRFADGELRLDTAELDFRGEETKMSFQIEADRIDPLMLPGSWKLPTTIRNRVSGDADLGLTIRGGLPIAQGSGRGWVEIGLAALFPIPVPGIEIRADARGFRFEPKLITPPARKPPVRPAGGR